MEGLMRVEVTDDGGVVTDITEGVRTMYDLVINSMDWGSGFFTVEDAIPVAEVAQVCGFEQAEQAVGYVVSQANSVEQKEFLLHRFTGGVVAVHDHIKGKQVGGAVEVSKPTDRPRVYAYKFRCLWPQCSAVATTHGHDGPVVSWAL